MSKAGLINTMVGNFIETFDNLEKADDLLDVDDLVTIGRKLHEHYSSRENEGDFCRGENLFDNVDIITYLAKGTPVCMNCCAAVGNCSCEDKQIVEP